MKVLLSAYACAPGKGSEPEIGWRWMQQVSRSHDAWIITRAAKRAEVEAGLRREPAPRAHFVFVDVPRPLRFWKNWPFGIYLYYCVWQWLAYRTARRLNREIGFDLAQHVTFGAYWLPTFMALLGIPLVWGPVGGGETAPKSFRRAMRWRGRILEWMRDLSQAAAALHPLTRLTARRSFLALATSQETADRLSALGCRNVRVISSIGITLDQLSDIVPAEHAWRDRLRIMSAGRLLHWKGFDLALRSVARLQADGVAVDYVIFGKGPERRPLEKLARRLGVVNSVTFHDPLPRAQLLRTMGEFDVLLHPSLHDSGAFVCVEAMMAGCPVACLDLGGPALQVSDTSGIKVPAISPEQAIRELAGALRELADPQLRNRFARAGRERARTHLLWDTKLDCLDDVYATRGEVHA